MKSFQVASANGNIEILKSVIHTEDDFYEWKFIAKRDGSFEGHSRNNNAPKWKKFSYGKKAAERFQWAKEEAEAFFAG